MNNLKLIVEFSLDTVLFSGLDYLHPYKNYIVLLHIK